MTEQAQIDWEKAFATRAAGMRASEIRELLKLLEQPDILSFAGGIPDPALFPSEAISEAYASILADPQLSAAALQYSVSEGYLPLRRWLVGQMARLGVPCDVDNIVITSGSQQGLDFLGKLFLSPGDTALVMAPTYLGALQAFNAYEPRYDTLNLDEGAPVPGAYRDAAQAAGGRVAMAYVVPDFANPTGETLDEGARSHLLDLINELNIPLIEDAAYEALRFEGEPVTSCLALDLQVCGSIDRSRVVYCGTFSKTIAPGLRVGWICAARDLVHKIVLAKQSADLHSAGRAQPLRPVRLRWKRAPGRRHGRRELPLVRRLVPPEPQRDVHRPARLRAVAAPQQGEPDCEPSLRVPADQLLQRHAGAQDQLRKARQAPTHQTGTLPLQRQAAAGPCLQAARAR
jgi:DNA-binding transcriptional MocR family regulator